jgi:hypothetical protein
VVSQVLAGSSAPGEPFDFVSNSHLTIRLAGDGGARLLEKAEGDARHLDLYVDGERIPETTVTAPRRDGPDGERVEFRVTLERTEENAAVWGRVLGAKVQLSQLVNDHQEHAFSVGTSDGEWVADAPREVASLPFPVVAPAKHWSLAIFEALGLALFVHLAFNTPLLRDGGWVQVGGRRVLTTWSLARTQMAAWFLLTVAGFLFIWALTGEIPILPNAVLILAGLGTATHVGSVLVEKAAGASQEHATQGMLHDLLSDQDGYSVPRIQMAVWTVVLAFVYVSTVVRTLSMPDFPDSLLALTGISSGSYLALKMREERRPAPTLSAE